MTHVFISYQHLYQDYAIYLRDALQSQGFQTWIDVDDMVGSTLDRMAEAVQNAAVVIMCMSESYKASKNCKKEIGFAARKHKPIIPICFETGFKPDGWLGIVAESNMVIDFSDPDEFHDNFRQLRKELDAKGVAPNQVDEDDEDDEEDEVDDERDDRDEEDDEDEDDDEEDHDDDGAMMAYGNGAMAEADDTEVVMVMERMIIRQVKKLK